MLQQQFMSMAEHKKILDELETKTQRIQEMA
jgi:hypothetical protein